MGAMDAGLSETRSHETAPTPPDRASPDEASPVAVRLGAKGAWNGAWQALNTPVGVVLSVVVAFGSVLGILMSIFLGELRAMEQRLRQDMAAMEERLRQDMAAMEERLRQDMAAMEERLQAQITELRVAHLQGALGAEADGEPPEPGPSQDAAPKAGAGTPEGTGGGTS